MIHIKLALHVLLLIANFTFLLNSHSAVVPLMEFSPSNFKVLFKKNHFYNALFSKPHQLEINDSIHYSFKTNTEKLQLKTTVSNALDMVVKEYVYNNVTGENIETVLSSSNTFKNLKNILRSQKALALVFISNDELAFSTAKGLFYYNIPNEELKLIIKGLTFSNNTYFIKDRLIMESKNGMITLNYQEIKNIINGQETSEANMFTTLLKKDFLYLVSVLAIVFVLYSCFLLIKRRQLNFTFFRGKNKSFKKEEKKNAVANEVSKEAILTYMQDNIAKVSVSDICEHFELSNRMLYAKLAPDKPGAIISALRKNKLKILIETNTSMKDAASITGFSIHHIKKVKNELSSI
ncbi:hypothetical protein CLV33_103100 [Jejuia pallidilutea]|uniref:Uncharacterized protein n=1 Tax=Jejuia pallidilutea TaxID=504487 RepID=A0A362X4F5_9FLAO|nr:hypothetical protein [Jejuia pallidilutea]PQV49469.1 hypothetical protein CLV33_103100 [Jejuia pallidilutea]